jgi:hypothetical protein
MFADTGKMRKDTTGGSSFRLTSIAPRIDFAGAASFAFFFSAKGAGLDAALPIPSARRPVEPAIVFAGALRSRFAG